MEVVPPAAVEPRPWPSPVRAPSAPAAPLRRTLGLVTLAWMFGSIWFNTTTGEPLTLFAQKLGANHFQFGVLTAVPFLASLLAVPGSLLIEWTGRRKRVFLWSLYVQRAMWLVIPLVPLALLHRGGPGATGNALFAFLLLMTLMYAAGALGGPAWVAWMSDVVPARINGKYFSRRRQWGILTAVPAALFVGWFLDHGASGGPGSVIRWCSLFFVCSAVCGLMDIHLFQYVPAAPRPPRTGMQLLHALAEPLQNRAFMRYSLFIAMLTFAVNLLGQFATLYLLEQVRMDNLGVQMALVVAPMLAQLAVLGAWGRAADRLGKRPLLVLGSVGLVPVGIAWCFVTPGTLWLAYLLSALGAALWTGIEVANMNLVLETSTAKAHGGSSYPAMNSVIINLAGCLGGLSAGVIAELLGDWTWRPVPGAKTFTYFDVLFLAGGLLRLASVVVFLPLLRGLSSPPPANVSDAPRPLPRLAPQPLRKVA